MVLVELSRLLCILAEIRSKGYSALVTTTFGITVSILPKGRIGHSQFKIPIDISDSATCQISKRSSLATLIKGYKLIIWDKILIVKRVVIEVLNDLLRELMSLNEFFGEKNVVFGGVFRQILSIV